MQRIRSEAAHRAPANILFPEAYASTKKQILKDYLFFGSFIVWGIVLVALMGTGGH